MNTVLVAGDFGKLHSGHLLHIARAYDLGDWLHIVTHDDSSIIKRKSYIPDNLTQRVFLLNIFLKGLGGKGDVSVAQDEDGTVAATIRSLSPRIFAKGGEYTIETLPPAEVEACRSVGCEIVFGIGAKLNQSRDIARSA